MVARAITWPAGIFPRSGMFGFGASSRSGGQSISGSEQITTMNPTWRASFSGPVVTEESVLSWRAFVGAMSGRAGTVLVPRWEAYGPVDANGRRLSYVETASYDGGGLNFDLSGFGQQEVAYALLASPAGINATRISVDVLNGPGPRPGQYFGLGNRLYLATAVWWETEDAPTQIQFTPWLRTAAPAGARVILDRPVCLMRFAQDQSGELELDMGLWGNGSFEFVEASPGADEAVQVWNGSVASVGASAALPAAPNFQTINYSASQSFGGRSYIVTSATNPYNIQRASNYGLTRFEVRNGDLRAGDPSDRERAELSGSPFAFSGAGEIWVSYSMLPLDLDASWWTTVFQGFGLAHGANTIEGPVLKIEHNNGGTETEINIAGNSTNAARVQRDLWKGTAFQEGKIYNLVWKLKFSGTVGEATLWINGVQMFSETQLPMGFGADPLTYFKYGIYRDVQTGDQPPCIVVFSDPEYAQGTNALLARVNTPTPMPYYSGTVALGAITGNVVYAPSYAAEADFNPAHWVLLEAEGSTATNSPAGTLSLIGGGVSYGAAADQELLTSAGVAKVINFTVAGSSVSLRIGTSQGDEQIMALTSYPAGTHSVQFTPTGTSTWVRFNKQANAESVVSAVSLSNPIATVGPELNVDPSFDNAAQWALYGSGIGTTAVTGGAMDVLSTTSTWAFRIKNGDALFPAGSYRLTITVADWVSGAFSPTGHASDMNVIATGNSQLGTASATGNGVHTWDIELAAPMHLGIRGRSGVADMRVTDLSLRKL